MLDAWIIDEYRRRERPALELPLLPLPIYPDVPALRDEPPEPDPLESRGRVIVIDLT